MGERDTSGRISGRTRRWLVAAPLVVGAAALAAPIGAGAATAKGVHHASPKFELKVVDVHGHGAVLATGAGDSLYSLTSEKGAKLTCKGRCATLWPPLVVGSKVDHVRVAKGVKGRIGFVRRGAKEKQVTYNGYPLYGFVGDKGPHEDHGEGIVNFGGTWGLIRPSTRTVTATLILPAKQKSATTTTKASSSSGSGGYGGSSW